jgi:prophage maintenance system killer protein
VIRYVSLAEYMWLAEQVTGVDADVLAKASRSDLADSALHAPQAGFGDNEFYPDIFDKAAVLVCRLAWNHPLMDGNKRAAWAALVMFVDINQGSWLTLQAMVSLAAWSSSRRGWSRTSKPRSRRPTPRGAREDIPTS